MAEKVNPRTIRARNSIMEATRRAVAKKPSGDISLTEIAKDAGVSRATIYKMFSDSTTLVAKTAETMIEESLNDNNDGEANAQLDDRTYFSNLMSNFVSHVYAERDFCHNVMYGPSAAKTSVFVIEKLDARMRERRIGERLKDAGVDADDCRAAISAGMVWMLTKWLDSDFKGENSPEKMADRLATTLFELSR